MPSRGPGPASPRLRRGRDRLTDSPPRLCRARQREPESGSASGSYGSADAASVRFDNRLDDSQTETETRRAVIGARRGFEEPIGRSSWYVIKFANSPLSSDRPWLRLMSSRKRVPVIPNHTDISLESARTSYVADLQRVHLHFDEQMSYVHMLLRSLLGDDAPVSASPLDSTRALYLERVRAPYRTLDEQVLELAKACSHLFAPALGLPAAA